jgi:hypothetical protein
MVGSVVSDARRDASGRDVWKCASELKSWLTAISIISPCFNVAITVVQAVISSLVELRTHIVDLLSMCLGGW